MECPRCGLESPPASSRCDCGHRFKSAIRIDSGGGLYYEGESPRRKVETKTFTYHKAGDQYWIVDKGGRKTLDQHASEMLGDGWTVMQSAGGGGHVNVGRTALRVMALGLPVLIFGASRAAESVTVTYTRDE